MVPTLASRKTLPVAKSEPVLSQALEQQLVGVAGQHVVAVDEREVLPGGSVGAGVAAPPSPPLAA